MSIVSFLEHYRAQRGSSNNNIWLWTERKDHLHTQWCHWISKTQRPIKICTTSLHIHTRSLHAHHSSVSSILPVFMYAEINTRSLDLFIYTPSLFHTWCGSELACEWRQAESKSIYKTTQVFAIGFLKDSLGFLCFLVIILSWLAVWAPKERVVSYNILGIK